eukprot:6073900-Prorocentrum_lima.AAC.1
MPLVGLEKRCSSMRRHGYHRGALQLLMVVLLRDGDCAHGVQCCYHLSGFPGTLSSSSVA